MRANLTPAFCLKAQTEDGAERSVYWDAEMPGFGLVVTKSGHLARHFRQMLASRPDSALTRALRGSLAPQIVFVNGRIAQVIGVVARDHGSVPSAPRAGPRALP